MTSDHHHHGHHHGPSDHGWRRLVHRLSHVTGHHHDSADRIDRDLETSEQGIQAVRNSLVLLLITAVLQGVVVAVSGSVALLADTLHNVADALTAIPLWIAFRLGRRPATRRFRYGLGRAEDLAGLFVIAMIAISALVAVVAAVDRLVDPRPIDHVGLVALAAAIGFAGNEIVARYRISVGRRIGSAALVADGLHARTDALTSLAVVASAIGVAAGAPIVDPLVAIGIALMIVRILFDATRQVVVRMLDGVDEEVVGTAEETLVDLPFVHGVDDVRMRWVGHRLWAEIDITVDPELDFADAHAAAHEAEHVLFHELPRLGSVTVHAHPSDDRAEEAHRVVSHHRSTEADSTWNRTVE